jgi:hypothetical protein
MGVASSAFCPQADRQRQTNKASPKNRFI